jgi:hypothetical protein
MTTNKNKGITITIKGLKLNALVKLNLKKFIKALVKPQVKQSKPKTLLKVQISTPSSLPKIPYKIMLK